MIEMGQYRNGLELNKRKPYFIVRGCSELQIKDTSSLRHDVTIWSVFRIKL